MKKPTAASLIMYSLFVTAVFTGTALADEPEASETQDVSTADSQQAAGGASEAEMAKKLANPLASMISMPMQLNYDHDMGTDDSGDRYLLNIQPVVPISLTENWNVISRTILPVITQNELVSGSGRQSGLGDTTETLWFSPVKPTDKGLIWGIGPVVLIPTATDDLLGGEKWGVGPTAIVLKQIGGMTIGALGNHIWSVAGSDNREDINSTFIQPFLAYNTPAAWTYTINLESSYDWESEQWSIPVNLMVSKLKRYGHQMINYQGGVRYWIESTDSGPEGLGLRFAVTLLFPK